MHDVQDARTCVTRDLILNYTNGKIPDFQHGGQGDDREQ